ncbi:MAG TPA: two-component regulator propeller domain-containing protein [Chryseolinea sp.]|nr:two-component regulator propeller domain-containing protein [Chryseolinea sp.]
MPNKIFLWIVISFALGQAYAQNVQYKFLKLDVNKGLSHNQPNCFLKDRKGFIWIGTNSGLNRFDGYGVKVFMNDPRDTSSISISHTSSLAEGPDGRIWAGSSASNGGNFTNVYNPETESFTRNTRNILKQYGIPDGSISNIIKDSKGLFWFIHSSQGVFRYNPQEKKSISVPYVSADSTSMASNQIASFVEDRDGNFWMILKNGSIKKIDGKTLLVTYRNNYLKDWFNNELLEYKITTDRDGDIWVCPTTTNDGIFYFDLTNHVTHHIHEKSEGWRLNKNIVRNIVEDNQGMIWVGTDHGGINVIDKKKKSVTYILTNAEDNRSLSQNSITSLYKDYEGIIWVGTYKKGACYYHENIVRFPLFRHEDKLSTVGLHFDDMNRFAEDDKGNLWLGTNGGGLVYFDRQNNTYKQYHHNPADPNSLSNDVIVSMCIDSDKVLWVGTYYGGLNSFDGKKFTRYKHNPNDSTSIADDNIWELFEDKEGKLWIGTLYNGVDVLDRKTKKIKHYPFGRANSVHSNYISEIKEDAKGNMWIGTGWGFDVFDKKTEQFTHYLNQNNDPHGLSSNSILCFLHDSRGRIWIGTFEGLNLFDPQKNTYTTFYEKDGLPHNTILTLLEDNNGNLWMSTPNGISNLVISRKETDGGFTFQFKNYDESDGLQGRQFNENAALKTRSGELIFGGASGFNIFRPEKIVANKSIPQTVLSDFQLFNKSVGIGEIIGGRTILSKSITETKEIILPPVANVISIEFASLNFFRPDKSSYVYMLEGFNKYWTAADGKSRKITYTNLDPGSYTFRVKSSNSDGVWSDNEVVLKIVILPPFWKTRTAFILYILLILGALLLSRKILVTRERLKYKIAHERQEAQRMHELDVMKMRFFTNVSHEFRTPLTLILTPLEKMLKADSEPPQPGQLQLIHRNAKRLLNLVNQLLDFRKLEVQEIKLNLSEGDIIAFIRETVYSFSDLSEKKNIQLDYTSSVATLETTFDQDKVEKIMFNLLSNAFKFTPEYGAVSVSINEVGTTNERALEIQVKDTGIGIPLNKQEKIFERFFQNDLPSSVINQGSGIGLSITKEFVRLQEGTIEVKSEVGHGSCFTVVLPIKHVLNVESRLVDESPLSVDVLPNDIHSDNADLAKIPTLLLVEDNEDFRFYLKDNLRFQYHIIEAKDGVEGWSKALAALPDLIVSDIMMPRMNGLELCKKVKSDTRVSHVPVILLTARTAEEQKLEGFESGADDYVTKPFNFEILQSRIKNLIHKRELFQKDFRRQIEIKGSDVVITSMDEKLIQKAIQYVEEKIGDADFSVEDLSHELAMSRVHLYKKLLALTGKSPLEFIRSLRLQRAAQLLSGSQLTVAEVAYQVGFNNPKYFAKYFKEEFGMLPSAYSAQQKKKAEDS